MFPRSANKPFQSAGMLRAGLRLDGAELAMATASHSGEPFHLRFVEAMLAEHGLDEEQLGCPPDLPLDAAEAERYLAAGGVRRKLAMNCSGKHTAMLAVCQQNDWPLAGYLDPGHPLQQALRATLESAVQEPVAHTGVDGCGAPLLAVSLTGLARGFRALATAEPNSPEGRVAAAMRAHPAHVAGTRRHDTWLMRELPGVVSKMGAEGVQGLALPDGRALAFKIDDGGARALGPVLVSLLTQLGVAGEVLERVAQQPVLGGGQVVGEVRATV